MILLRPQKKTQVEQKTLQLNNPEFISRLLCRIENSVWKGWPESDANMRNREHVKNSFSRLCFGVKTSGKVKEKHKGQLIIQFDICRKLSTEDKAKEKTLKIKRSQIYQI